MEEEHAVCPDCETCPAPSEHLTRRNFLKAGVGGLMGLWVAQWLNAAQAQTKAKAVVLLWMNGGPSQLDTFDPKPNHRNGGPVKAIKTRAPDILLSEYLPQLAEQADKLAVVRSIVSREGNHDRGRLLMHTGYVPTGAVAYPNFGSVVAKELGDRDFELPHFVSVRGPSVNAGFLGADFNPLVVTDPRRPIPNLSYPAGVDAKRFELRMRFLNYFEKQLRESTNAKIVENHENLYAKATRLMHSPMLKVFDVTQEPAAVRRAYGENPLGEGALMARRLVEAGVKFVEVSLDGWDTHNNNFVQTRRLCEMLDPALSTLLKDLQERRLLSSTLVIWMGEFGRTPRINNNEGRDHWAQGWSVALAGAGIKGGQVIGATNEDGTQVAARPIAIPDLFASFCHALHLNPNKQNYTAEGRPIRIVDRGTVIKELFA